MKQVSYLSWWLNVRHTETLGY